MGYIASVAEALVIDKFIMAARLANSVEQRAFAVISALLTLAKAETGIDINLTVPLDLPDVSMTSPFALELVKGNMGFLSNDTWAHCTERAQLVLNDSISVITKHFYNLPLISFYALLQFELDKGSYHLLDISRARTAKEFDASVEFAKLIVKTAAEFELVLLEVEEKQMIAKAELMLKQFEIGIRELLAKSELVQSGYQSAGTISAHMAASIAQGISASASVAASGSEQDEKSSSHTQVYTQTAHKSLEKVTSESDIVETITGD